MARGNPYKAAERPCTSETSVLAAGRLLPGAIGLSLRMARQRDLGAPAYMGVCHAKRLCHLPGSSHYIIRRADVLELAHVPPQRLIPEISPPIPASNCSNMVSKTYDDPATNPPLALSDSAKLACCERAAAAQLAMPPDACLDNARLVDSDRDGGRIHDFCGLRGQ